MQRYQRIPCYIMILLYVSCSSISCKDASANRPGAGGKYTSLPVNLRKDCEIETNGKYVTGTSDLLTLVAVEISNDKREVELTTEIALSVDEQTTVRFLNEVIRNLQANCFSNIVLVSGESRILLPPTAVNSSDSGLDIVTLKLSAAQDGSLSAIEMVVAGRENLNFETDDVASMVQQARTSLVSILADPDRVDPAESNEFSIELVSDPGLLAKDFLACCESMNAIREERGDELGLQIQLWPIGYPSAESVESIDVDMNLMEEIEYEEIEPPSLDGSQEEFPLDLGDIQEFESGQIHELDSGGNEEIDSGGN